MNRYTFRGFPYPEESPMGRLQNLENMIEDGKLVEVVRCKDCVMHEEGCPLDTHPYMTVDDGFCYLGKPKPQKGGADMRGE